MNGRARRIDVGSKVLEYSTIHELHAYVLDGQPELRVKLIGLGFRVSHEGGAPIWVNVLFGEDREPNSRAGCLAVATAADPKLSSLFLAFRFHDFGEANACDRLLACSWVLEYEQRQRTSTIRN